ncbi:MAG: hypothetical protein ACYC56_11670 [Candidatus Aquicultor sp.]
MKKVIGFIIVGLLMAVSSVSAQWATNYNARVTPTKQYLEIYFSGTLDSTGQTYGSLTSNVFSLADYDGVADIDYHYLITNALGSPDVKITLLHSDLDQTAANMVATVLKDTIKTESELSSYLSLQGVRAKYYRLKIESLATGRDGSIFKIMFILPKRDF